MKYILILLLTIFLMSCGITDFDMPTWDVELTSIPLINEDYPASDLEGDNILVEDGHLIGFVEDTLVETTPDLSKNIVDSTPNVGLESNNPELIRFEIQSINSNTSFRIIQGKFESGEMLITFTGDLNNIDELELTFDQLVTEDNELLVLMLQAEDFTDNQYIIDLAGLSLIDQDIDGEFWLINIHVIAYSSLPTGTDVGAVKLSIDDELFFSEFTGFINDIRTLDTETNVDIDYPDNVENAIILDQISLFFDVYNKIGFDFNLKGDFIAYRDGEVVDSIAIDQLDNVDFFINASPEIGEMEITHIEVLNNERVNQMLQKMPDRVAFHNPTYIVNNFEDILPGFVTNEHTISSDYRIEIPFRASFNDDYLIYPDRIHEVEISENNQELIDEHVNNANVQLTLLNEFPIGGILDIFLSSQPLAADSLELEGAELKFLGYDVQVSDDDQIYEIELSEDDLNLFLRDKVFMRTRARFHNSDGVVVIMADDNFNVRGSLNVNLYVEVD